MLIHLQSKSTTLFTKC